jgi:hypothetical protein
MFMATISTRAVTLDHQFAPLVDVPMVPRSEPVRGFCFD